MPDLLALIFNHTLHLTVLARTAEFIERQPLAAVLLFLGLVLVLNPIALLGFGPRGRPLHGSIAERWQARAGGRGKWFRGLCRLGEEGWVLIPAVGGGLVVAVGGWAWARGELGGDRSP
ncbi:hypothetical protein EDC01DRAFT_787587 [Geopyxis carbonaria]|nr:hypothetical protein EDC01DRAFT_787587 [Geopyxis carbonaria]